MKSAFEGWREEGCMVFVFFHLLLFINYLLLFITLEGEGEHGFFLKIYLLLLLLLKGRGGHGFYFFIFCYVLLYIYFLNSWRGPWFFCSFFVNFFFSFVSFSLFCFYSWKGKGDASFIFIFKFFIKKLNCLAIIPDPKFKIADCSNDAFLDALPLHVYPWYESWWWNLAKLYKKKAPKERRENKTRGKQSSRSIVYLIRLSI